VWIDGTMDPSDNNWQQILDEMDAIVNTSQVFTHVDKCHSYIQTMEERRALIISSGSLGGDILPKMHGLEQVDAIYIIYGDTSWHAEWAQEWTKIKGVHKKLRPIREAIEGKVKHINYNDTVINFVSSAQFDSTNNLDQLEPSFMYIQLFNDVFLAIEYDDESKAMLVAYCRDHYQNNLGKLAIVNEFAITYKSSDAIRWYTRE
jgi:hypothetical protein